MILECGYILISCPDHIFLESEMNELGYKHFEVEVNSSEKKHSLTIRINSGLTFEQKLQAVVINTIARLTFDPNRSKDAWPLNYVSFETRMKDYDGGYWEQLVCKNTDKINLDTSIIIGRGLIA